MLLIAPLSTAATPGQQADAEAGVRQQPEIHRHPGTRLARMQDSYRPHSARPRQPRIFRCFRIAVPDQPAHAGESLGTIGWCFSPSFNILHSSMAPVVVEAAILAPERGRNARQIAPLGDDFIRAPGEPLLPDLRISLVDRRTRMVNHRLTNSMRCSKGGAAVILRFHASSGLGPRPFEGGAAFLQQRERQFRKRALAPSRPTAFSVKTRFAPTVRMTAKIRD
ncbi:MAG: hypothetical protein QOF19_613 [Alphaproteobacteria bacterium]|nr:hypothetical protein [Alphaproteobacteria bacterium]